MIRVTFAAAPPLPLDLTGVTPDQFLTRSALDLAGTKVLCGNRNFELGEFARVGGDPAGGAWVIDGETANLRGVGARMDGGSIVVEGDVGRHAASQMTGGELLVRGDAGDWLAAELRGGTVRVSGSAGHCVCAAYRGSRLGVRGGLVVVAGDVGDEAGLRMRRGCLAVGGRAGAFAGAAMIAGTLVLAGGCGPGAGSGLKRGTVVAPHAPLDSPGWRKAGRFSLAYFALLARQLGAWGAPGAGLVRDGSVELWRGDRLEGGRGEWAVSAALAS